MPQCNKYSCILQRLTILILGIILLITPQAQAQDMAFALPQMNVVYIGVANPITVAAEKTKSSDLVLTTDNGRLEKKDRPNCYDYFPDHPGNGAISVSINNATGHKKIGELACRVKDIPPPVVRLAGRSEGKISRALLCALIAPSANIEGFDFEAHTPITQLKVMVVVDDQVIFEKIITDSVGVRFDEETKKIFCSLNKGSIVWLNGFVCRFHDRERRDLNDIRLEIE